jgi:hypothetical protein
MAAQPSIKLRARSQSGKSFSKCLCFENKVLKGLVALFIFKPVPAAFQ